MRNPIARPSILSRPALWFAGAFLLNLTACPGPNPKKTAPSQATQQTLFVKGDPMTLVAGAHGNPTSPITEENIQLWNQFVFSKIAQFVEKEEIIQRKETNIEAENVTKESSDSEANPIRIERGANGEWTLVIVGTEGRLALTRMPDGRLQPTRFYSAKASYALTPLHWSVALDRHTVSFLAAVDDPKDPSKGRGLLAFYFEKQRPEPAHVPTTVPKYVYVSGPGRKVGWSLAANEELNVQLCGSPGYANMVKNAVEAWQPALRDRLPLKFSVAQTYAPFSDLNQHCIYIVDAYVNEQRSDVFNFGETWPILSRYQAKIIDADIFIFKAEIDKVRQYAVSKGRDPGIADSFTETRVPMAVSHEVGHLLGLGHKFDGTPSIMSYDWKYPLPQAYDTEALEELYPLRTATP